MDYQIKGKYAFVNAGAHGIGEATADLLTQEGASVIVADRDEAALQQKARRWAGVIAADLATADGVEQATAYVLATFGRAPDILVNFVKLLTDAYRTSAGISPAVNRLAMEMPVTDPSVISTESPAL